MALNALAAACGIFVVLVVLRDIFQVIIVPRAVTTVLRISRYQMRLMWHLWPRIAYRLFRSADGREDFLASFAPFFLVSMLAVWLVALVIGWGLIFYGIRSELRPGGLTFGDTIYYAGSSMLTAYGDIAGRTFLARMVSLAAAASGVASVAVIIAFLFQVFGSFQRRETFVVTIGARAGVPPSGVGLLMVHGHPSLRRDLADVFRDAQQWTADVMESHLAYPILALFRSSHDFESWVGTLGTILDASALVLTTLEPSSDPDGESHGQAQITYALGRHLTHDFSRYYEFASLDGGAGVERSEFENACDQLSAAGYAIGDRALAWTRFSELRATYAPDLNAMARWLEIPPVQWVGDRSPIAPAQLHRRPLTEAARSRHA